jgi:hypothetical protein
MIATTNSIPVSQPTAPATGSDRLVSIVIPCYGGEPFLAEAIESCLAQTYRDFELIIVDDASPDRCLAIAERYAQRDKRIHLVRRSQNGGVARAFNSGFEVSRGGYLTRLAQDDAFEEHALEAMVETLKTSDPPADLVYCDCTAVDRNGNYIRTEIQPDPKDALRFGNRLDVCVMWTRRVWDAVGGFDPACDAAEDYDYWLRVSGIFRLVKCQAKPALRGRWHLEKGSIKHLNRQVASTFLAVRKNHRRTFASLGGWRTRQLALVCARITACNAHCDQMQPWRAICQLCLSFFEWPFPISDPRRCRIFRIKRLVAILRLILLGNERSSVGHDRPRVNEKRSYSGPTPM